MARSAVTHTFRIAFWRMYPPVVVYAQVLYAPVMWGMFFVLAWVFSRPFPTVEHAVLYVAGSVLILVLLAPAFWLYVRRLVVKVSVDGFTCSNGFGKLRTVAWADITGVRRLILPGFPYLLVNTWGSGFPLWLPLFLGRMPEFAERVERHAGADHVLYQAVWPAVEQK